MDVEFGNTKSMDNFLEQAENTDEKDFTQIKIKNKQSNATFPLVKFRNLGAKVFERGDGIVVSFRGMVVASKVNVEFVKRILDEDNELIQISDKPLWNVEQLSHGKFFITKA